jgi:hypothetical protein
MGTVGMKLTLVVYTCPECNYDTTSLVERIKDIRRNITVQCHNPDCPSNIVDGQKPVKKEEYPVDS